MSSHKRFSYADYEAAIRGPFYGDLRQIAADTAQEFQGCASVLDIASGQGFLLDALRSLNIEAMGIDSEPTLVEECCARGLRVIQSDVIDFLKTTLDRFDGAYCGHLIEHLPYDTLLDLIEGVQRVLKPGGKFIVRWPNPRSGDTVFHSYWKDPTHTRFYDGEFVEALLKFYGFNIAEANYLPTARRVVSGHTAQVENAARTLPFEPSSLSPKRRVGWQIGEICRRALMEPLRIHELFRRVHQLRQEVDNLAKRGAPSMELFEVPVEAVIIAIRLSEE